MRKSNDNYHIIIEENVIRPAGGGQAGERGVLLVGDQQVNIIDTIYELDTITLVTDGSVIEKTAGTITVDMHWRFSMMRNHTAEHLFVSQLQRKHKKLTVGNLWIDGRQCSVELLNAVLDLDEIFEAEDEINRIIEDNLPVRSRFIDSNQIGPNVRSREGLTDKYEELRVVSIGDFDSSACSGIHVTNTGEIGFCKVLDVKFGANSVKIELAAGLTASHTVSNVYNEALRRKNTYPFEMEQLGAVLDKAKLAIDERKMMVEKTTQLLTSGPSFEHVRDVGFYYEYLAGYDSNSLRILANQLTYLEPSVTLLFSPGPKSQLILKVSKMPKDSSEYISRAVNQHGGQGGGKGEIFTGGFADVANPKELFKQIVKAVRDAIS